MALRLIPGRTYFRHKASGLVWGFNELYRQSPQFEEFVYVEANDAAEDAPEGEARIVHKSAASASSDDISDILEPT